VPDSVPYIKKEASLLGFDKMGREVPPRQNIVDIGAFIALRNLIKNSRERMERESLVITVFLANEVACKTDHR
jgi:hypothetical protein